MIMEFFRRALSFGISEKMEEEYANHIRIINLYHVLFAILVILSIVFSIILSNAYGIFINGTILFAEVLVFVLLPPFMKPTLNSILLLILSGAFILSGYLFSYGPDESIVMGFYLLFPVIAVTLHKRFGIIVALALGAVTIPLHFIFTGNLPANPGNFSFLLFITGYFFVLLFSLIVVSNNRQVFEKIRDKDKQLEKEIEQKDIFISGLSHRLRTSLSNITLINNLVHDNRMSAEQKELLDALKNSTNTLITDVNNIVEIATPGLISFEETVSSFNLMNVMQEVRQVLESDKQFYGNIAIHFADSPEFEFIGDQSILKTTLIFLSKGLGNYMNEDGHLKIDVLIRSRHANEALLRFHMEIKSSRSEEIGRHIEDIRTGKDYAISNLANAIHLINQTDRKLEADFTKNRVRLFFDQVFTLDLTRAISDIITPEPAIKEPTDQKIKLQEARVLLVEDNEINQKIVLLSLSKAVESIEVACNGKEAVDRYMKGGYDIILMDIMMPVMDGIEATRRIRELESTTSSRIPIIAITANALAGDRDNCLAAGVDDYLSKPFSVEELIKMMKNLLE